VAEAMGVKFLATGAKSPNWTLNLEPYNYQADALSVCYYLLPHEDTAKSPAVVGLLNI